MTYLILKTTEERINETGSLFEAVRGHWSLDPEHAAECDYVVAVIDKVVQAVYKVDKWYKSTVLDDRFTFAGELDIQETAKFYGQKLNSDLTLKGAQNPVRYCEENLVAV